VLFKPAVRVGCGMMQLCNYINQVPTKMSAVENRHESAGSADTPAFHNRIKSVCI
jgi:hypothetical protein